MGGRPLAPGSFADTYRKSSSLVIGLLIMGWNIAYWYVGFYPRIQRLCPEVQARTGAQVRIGYRSVEWDRPVEWRDALALKLHFLGLLLVALALWGLLNVAGIAVSTLLQDGPAGVVAFFRG